MGSNVSVHATQEEFEDQIPDEFLPEARRAVDALKDLGTPSLPTKLATSMAKDTRYILEHDDTYAFAYFIGQDVDCEELPQLHFVFAQPGSYAGHAISTLFDLERGINFIIYVDDSAPPAPESSPAEEEFNPLQSVQSAPELSAPALSAPLTASSETPPPIPLIPESVPAENVEGLQQPAEQPAQQPTQGGAEPEPVAEPVTEPVAEPAAEPAASTPVEPEQTPVVVSTETPSSPAAPQSSSSPAAPQSSSSPAAPAAPETGKGRQSRRRRQRTLKKASKSSGRTKSYRRSGRTIRFSK